MVEFLNFFGIIGGTISTLPIIRDREWFRLSRPLILSNSVKSHVENAFLIVSFVRAWNKQIKFYFNCCSMLLEEEFSLFVDVVEVVACDHRSKGESNSSPLLSESGKFAGSRDHPFDSSAFMF